MLKRQVILILHPERKKVSMYKKHKCKMVTNPDDWFVVWTHKCPFCKEPLHA